VNDLLRKEIQDSAVKLRLPTIARQSLQLFERAGHQDAIPTFAEALKMECEARQERRIERLRVASKLPEGKTFGNLDKKAVDAEHQRSDQRHFRQRRHQRAGVRPPRGWQDARRGRPWTRSS
jgi:hypothetical protein